MVARRGSEYPRASRRRAQRVTRVVHEIDLVRRSRGPSRHRGADRDAVARYEESRVLCERSHGPLRDRVHVPRRVLKAYKAELPLKAIVAVMRKVARALWHVARGETFDVTKLFDVRRLDLASVTIRPRFKFKNAPQATVPTAPSEGGAAIV